MKNTLDFKLESLVQGTSLVVQEPRLFTLIAGHLNSIPGQGVRFPHATAKSSNAAAKDPAGYRKDRRSHLLQVRPNKPKKRKLGSRPAALCHLEQAP